MPRRRPPRAPVEQSRLRQCVLSIGEKVANLWDCSCTRITFTLCDAVLRIFRAHPRWRGWVDAALKLCVGLNIPYVYHAARYRWSLSSSFDLSRSVASRCVGMARFLKHAAAGVAGAARFSATPAKYLHSIFNFRMSHGVAPSLYLFALKCMATAYL